MKGLIFNIQKFSVNDGGGIRTVVFLKGCPLHCLWCSNPESQDTRISRIFWKNRCIACGKCRSACPLHIGNDMTRQAECQSCLACIGACPSKALEQTGEYRSAEEVMELVERDVMFYAASGGGVTLSGGEPLLQWEFAAELLADCRDACIDTAVETTGYAPYEHLKAVAEYSSRLLYDVKHMDSQVHKKYTGVGNERILENLKNILRDGAEVIVRVPLLHGVNDDWENIENTAEFALAAGVKELHLLPFHRYGEPKYEAIGRQCWNVDALVPEYHTTELMEKLSSMGLKVLVGG